MFLISDFPSHSRHSSDKVSKLEGQVESYKKKLEDLGDLRRQVKLLEEKNTMYMQNTVSLEEELRKANAARSQLETYKRQVKRIVTEFLNDVFKQVLHYNTVAHQKSTYFVFTVLFFVF